MEFVKQMNDDSSPIKVSKSSPSPPARYRIEQKTEHVVPTIEQDMSNHPGKTQAEVELWANGIIEIREEKVKTWTDRARFVPRAIFCADSKRAAILLPNERSWPIIIWSDFAGDKDFEYVIDDFLHFVFTGSLYMVDKVPYASWWFLGRTIGFPRYQNAVLVALMKSDNEFWEDACFGKDNNEAKESLRIIITDELYEFLRISEKSKFDAKNELQTYKLFSYMVDKVVWEALRGGNIWLDLIETKHKNFARVVAKTHVEALKNQQPRFPPWHELIQHKYLLAEKPRTAASSLSLVAVPGAASKQVKSTTKQSSTKRQRVE